MNERRIRTSIIPKGLSRLRPYLPSAIGALALLGYIWGCSISGLTGGSGDSDKGEFEIRNLAVESLTDTSAVIAWNTTESAVSVLRYSTSSLLANTLNRTTGLATAHKAALPNLAPQTTYFYEVMATSAGGDQDERTNLTFTTEAAYDINDSTPPLFLEVKVKGITSSSALVVWETDDRSWGEIFYGTSPDYDQVESEPISPQKKYIRGHSLVLTGLAEDTVYHFSVDARNAAGLGTQSDDATFRTLRAPTLFLIPDASSVAVGEKFRVAIHVEDAVNLAGLAVSVRYDGSALELLEEPSPCDVCYSGQNPPGKVICEGPFFCNNDGFMFLRDPFVGPGRLNIDASWELLLQDEEPVGTRATGSGDIFYVWFRALRSSAAADLSYLKDVDFDGDGKLDTRMLDHNRLDIENFHARTASIVIR